MVNYYTKHNAYQTPAKGDLVEVITSGCRLYVKGIDPNGQVSLGYISPVDAIMSQIKREAFIITPVCTVHKSHLEVIECYKKEEFFGSTRVPRWDAVNLLRKDYVVKL